MAAPTKAPITIPGPNRPPDPPVPIDSDVATILAIGSTMMIHNGIVQQRTPIGRQLRPAVATAQDLRDEQSQQADQQSADRGLEHRPAAEVGG